MSTGTMLRPFLALLKASVALGRNRAGSVAIEYGLIAALIVLAIVGVLSDVRDSLVGLPLTSLVNAFAAALS